MKIPMYNKGMGQAVATPAGKVSPRADIGTFAAPAQAAAQFANQVGQVAFQFGMAEKKRETDRVSNEEAVRIQSEADDLLLNNQDTETAVFSQNFKKFETKKLAEIDRIPNLTNSQRDEVKARVSRIMLSKAAAGKQNTFNKLYTVDSKKLSINKKYTTRFWFYNEGENYGQLASCLPVDTSR